MSPPEIFWLFLIASSLQPVIRQRMLEASRMRLLAQFERRRGSRAIALVHRQETMSLLGFPLMRYIDINDPEAVLRAIKLTDAQRPVDLIVHAPGGPVLAAGQIARALGRHAGKVTVFVPHHAMSGGTLIALAADEIVMDENAVLGPVDPPLGRTPAAGKSTTRTPKTTDGAPASASSHSPWISLRSRTASTISRMPPTTAQAAMAARSTAAVIPG